MLERIETAFATQHEFLDNVSHELRAPLTVIRGHVELLDIETDPVEMQSTIALVTDEIERMNRLVEDLLVLARAERPGFVSLAAVDLAELTTEVTQADGGRASVVSGTDGARFEILIPSVPPLAREASSGARRRSRRADPGQAWSPLTVSRRTASQTSPHANGFVR